MVVVVSGAYAAARCEPVARLVTRAATYAATSGRMPRIQVSDALPVKLSTN